MLVSNPETDILHSISVRIQFVSCHGDEIGFIPELSKKVLQELCLAFKDRKICY